MKIALCQTAGHPGKVEKNLALMEQAAGKAAAEGARLLVLPEMFLTGYNIGADAQRLAEPSDGPAASAAAAIARGARIALLYGYPERAEEGVYNSALLIDGQGTPLVNCRKTHLYGRDEKSVFCAGNRLAAAELEGIIVGLLICYDVEFPEAVRCLALAAADLIVVPTALMSPYCGIIDTVIPTRAYENQVYLAYANRCGSEGNLDYCGRSTIAGPDGKVTAQAGTGAEAIYADIRREVIAAARKQNPVLADRNPEAYRHPVEIFRPGG
jgi:predicted amidohydrolase